MAATPPIEGSGIEDSGLDGITFRRPTEDDYTPIVRVVDDWWGNRNLAQLLPRLWLQHFTGTSWVAEDERGRLAGFLVGFLSPDHPDTAYCHMVATNPNLRRRGLGAALYEHFFEDARAAGRTWVKAITWPGNRISLGFHRAIGSFAGHHVSPEGKVMNEADYGMLVTGVFNKQPWAERA